MAIAPMKIKQRSFFLDEMADRKFFEDWVRQLETLNGRTYESYEVFTPLGKTHVWGLHTREENRDTLVIFPGARTTALFWDFDQGLDHLKQRLNIYLVETNGLPNLSDGTTPDIKSLDYGYWAADVLDKMGIKKAFIAGASFGGLICMKLSIVRPEKIQAVFLLNPGCLQPFSLAFPNLYYKGTSKNILYFR
jgi:pimeloyl-ACP methyl ester carboxylesterase